MEKEAQKKDSMVYLSREVFLDLSENVEKASMTCSGTVSPYI
jgi:hypothetical protein